MFKFISRMVGKVKGVKRGKISAIILCAGSSTRFSDGRESKQFATVRGVPVILRTILTFERTDAISEIILVARKEDIEDLKSLVCVNGIKKVSCIVVGGSSRQESALKGFKHVSEKSTFVAIHDGARCMVTSEIIDKVISEAERHMAATAASRVTDTVKISDNDGFIKKTVNRENVWNVQTPQIFEKKLYTTAVYNAKQKGIEATDDCMLVENIGFKVKLVETGKENIKITVKDDICLAENILVARGDEL